MSKIRRVFMGGALVLMASGLASADSIVGTCSLAGPGGTELGGVSQTTSGAITCQGYGAFSVPVGAVLNSITLTIGGAVVNTEAFPSTITITNNTSSSQTGDAFTQVNYLLDNPSALPGFTFPTFGPPSSQYIFQAFGDTGTQTVAGNGTVVFNVSGSGSTGAVTDSNSATFGTYTGTSFGFQLDTHSSITSTFTGGQVNINQSTFADGYASVIYNYSIPGVPEPTTMVLLGSALIGLGVLRKRIRN